MNLYLYFLFKILLVNLIVMFLIYYKISNNITLSKNFNKLFLMILLLGIVNLYVIIIENILVSMSLLVFLSFYSMILVSLGYGSSYRIMVIIFFKVIADLFIFLIVSNMLIFRVDHMSFTLTEDKIEFYLLVIFLIYSLIGVFGF